MPNALVYRQKPCTLREVAHSTCPAGVDPSVYEHLLLNQNTTGSSLDRTFAANQTLVLPNSSAGIGDTKVTNLSRLQSCSRAEHEVLSSLSNAASGAATLGLASFLWDTKIPDLVGDLVTFGGNGMGASTAASSTLLASINKYDKALAQYEQLTNHRAAPRMVRAAKSSMKMAFDEMQGAFNKQSFRYLNNLEYKRRVTTNAAGRTVWESIPIGSNADVLKLEKLARAGKVLGPGVILLDGYLRANKVHHMRKANDENWRRERFIQTGAFVTGIGVGIALGILLAPAGIVLALMVGGAAGLLLDKGSQSLLRAVYDGLNR